jgi:hypothetical protein
MLKIQRMKSDDQKVWRCDRCNKELPQPVETASVYIFDAEKQTAILVCPDCLKESDLYIWGNTDVI